MKKALSLILAMLVLFSLCACKQTETDAAPNSDPEEIVISPIIFDTWYPLPEVGDAAIEILSDGTCTINGQKYTWVSESVEADKVVLIAGEGEDEYTLTFSQLTFPVPLLAATGLGVYIQQAELWKYVTEWYAPETADSFMLSFFELAQAGCKLTIEGSDMTVEVIKEGAVTHTIKFSGEQAIVTDAEGNSTTFEPLN